MTTADHIMTLPTDRITVRDRVIDLRWACSARACAKALGLDAREIHHHELATLRIAMQPLHSGAVRIHADLEHRAESVRIEPPRIVACRMTCASETISLDATDGPRRLVSCTLRLDGSLLYARSDLLLKLGLCGGTYDPAAVAVLTPARRAASA